MKPHPGILAAALLLAACAGENDPTKGDTAPLDPDCENPGSPTTPTPVTSGEATAMNVEALACTRTATELACELGTAHAYRETSDGTTRTLTANGIVDHDVGDFPNPGNPNAIAVQSYTYTVPVVPSGPGSTQQGVFGILTSGATLDPATAETWNDDPNWRYEALRYATAAGYFDSDGTTHPTALGVDCNLAHVQPGGLYHYHGVPTALLPSSPAVTQVGWAADGAPIVVGYGHEDATDAASPVRLMRGSYRLRSGERPEGAPEGTHDGTFVADWEYVAGLGDLDACNGRMDTLTVDGRVTTTYVYYLTDTYPYVPRCFTHTPDPSFARVDGGGGGGGGEPPDCAPGQTSRCCGDGVCDGPETADNCAADCG